MQGFRDVIDECGFINLGFQGLPFTWCNNRKGAAITWLRLDRYMVTNDWIMQFSSIVVYHIESIISDHKPIWMSPAPIEVSRPKRKPFRFEDMW